MKYLFISMAVVLSVSCNSQEKKGDFELKTASSLQFNNYWYAGEAELSSYDLQQIRYGEVHEGEVVLVFVTEDFSKTKQVKLDNPGASGSDAVKVLKLNQVREFNTGVYSYNMMSSTFSPVEGGSSLKVTTSSQDWCGHSFDQMNLAKDSYIHQKMSYFESEGDSETVIPIAILEDELMNMIRLDPSKLPTGNIEIIPSTLFSRLRHIPLNREVAEAKLERNESKMIEYTLEYSTIERKVKIVFEEKFPHRIMAWEEHHKTGFGNNAKKRVTRATLKETIKSPYWNKHGVKHAGMRDKLSLKF